MTFFLSIPKLFRGSTPTDQMRKSPNVEILTEDVQLTQWTKVGRSADRASSSWPRWRNKQFQEFWHRGPFPDICSLKNGWSVEAFMKSLFRLLSNLLFNVIWTFYLRNWTMSLIAQLTSSSKKALDYYWIFFIPNSQHGVRSWIKGKGEYWKYKL